MKFCMGDYVEFGRVDGYKWETNWGVVDFMNEEYVRVKVRYYGKWNTIYLKIGDVKFKSRE